MSIYFIKKFLNIIFLITSGLCALGILFRSPIVNLLGSGLPPFVKQLAEALVVIMFPSMIFTALAYSLTGVLQSYGSFHAPAAISLVSNGIMVAYLLFAGNRFGIYGVSWAMLVAWAFQLVVLLPSLAKKKYRYRPFIRFKNPGLKKALFLAVPILISSWVQPINTMVNMYLASYLNGGQAVSALDYANKLYIIFVGVLTYAISNLIFPSISRLAADPEKKTEFTGVMKTAIGSVLFILLPIMIVFLMQRTEIVRLVYERGAFGPEQTKLTSAALLWYSFGMLGYGMQEMLNKAFYAGQNGKTPMRVSVFGIVVNVAFSFLLVRGFNLGISGLPMAASVAANVIAVVLAVILNRQYKLFDRAFFINLFKLLVCGAVMVVGLYGTSVLCSFGDGLAGKFLAFFIPAAVGAIVYFVAAAFLKTNEMKQLKQMIKERK